MDVRRTDCVILRPGPMERCRKQAEWGGCAGGDAPGVASETCRWMQGRQVAGCCSDTWGAAVRPNERTEVNQPWHWVVIPAMGVTMGDIFDVSELAAGCAADGIHEFPVTAPSLIITGGTGSMIDPIAVT